MPLKLPKRKKKPAEAKEKAVNKEQRKLAKIKIYILDFLLVFLAVFLTLAAYILIYEYINKKPVDLPPSINQVALAFKELMLIISEFLK